MAQQAPVNPDLPSSVLIPGVFLKLNLSGGGGGLNSPSKRLLLLGNKLAAGTAAQDTPVQVTNQRDANNYFGQGSDLSRIYAAAVSQVGPGACDVFCLPLVEPSTGTAATHLITIIGTATTSGAIAATICGYTATAAITNGDTPTVIAANLQAAIAAIKDLPITSNASSGTITLTYAHKGLVGNDLPRIVNVTGATGVTASPGTITFAGASASGAGSVNLSVGGTSITGAVSNADTPTIIATTLTTAINAGGNPVTATATTGVVTLLYATDRVVHRINAYVATSTGITTTVSCGTLGAGASSLTNALNNIGPQAAYPVWCSSLNDGGNSQVVLGSGTNASFHGGSSPTASTIGTIATHIGNYASGYYQKGQRLFFGATEALAVSGGYQTSTGVNAVGTDAEARFAEIWQVDSPQQAYELAARAAADHIAQDYQPKNYAGRPLKTSGSALPPLLLPHRAVRSGQADQNAALLSYYMTPIAVNEQANSNYILRDRTTSTNSDQRLWSWGAIATCDYIRADLNAFLSTLFSGKSFKLVGPPRTPNVVTLTSIKEAIADRFRSYDSIDFVDDIDSITKGISGNQDAIVPQRVDLFVPIRIPVALYQIAGNINLS